MNRKTRDFRFPSLRLSTVQNRPRLTDQLGAVCRSPPSSEAKAFQGPAQTKGQSDPYKIAIFTFINGWFCIGSWQVVYSKYILYIYMYSMLLYVYTSHMDPISCGNTKHLGTGRTKRNPFKVIQFLTQGTMPPAGGYLSLDIPNTSWEGMDGPKNITN